MAEIEQAKNWLSGSGAAAIGIGFFVFILEGIIGSDSGLGAACCCFGVFGVVAGMMFLQQGLL